MDYTSGTYSVTFLAGNTVGALIIPIIDDNIFEENENFNLTINSSTLPIGAMVGYPGLATVTIVDYGGKLW